MASEEFAKLELGKSAIHIIYKPLIAGAKKEPYITDDFNDFEDKTKALLREKIISLLDGSAVISVVAIEGKRDTIIEKIKSLDKTSPEYINNAIRISKEIALKYYHQIDRRNKDCLIMFQEILMNDELKYAILILELQVGLQANPTSDSRKRSIDISYIEGLILSKQTRLFKIAFFPFRTTYDGIVCDTQSTSEMMVATFFINKFLDCTFVKIPKIATQDFYKTSISFINTLDDGRDKYLITLHLHSYLQSSEKRLSAKSFSEKLKPQYRQAYLSHFGANHISTEPFYKDLSKIKKDVEKEVIDFDIGISLIGHPKQIEKNVNIEQVQGVPNTVNVHFQSGIKHIGRS